MKIEFKLMTDLPEIKGIPVNTTKIDALLYPNVTIVNGGTFNEAEHDGLVDQASYLDYYNLAKN